MTAFSDIERDAFAAVEATFGEAILFLPRLGRISEPRPDPDRNPVQVTAIFTMGPDAPGAFSERREGLSSRGQTTIAVSGAILTIGAAEAAKIHSQIRTGDAVQLLARPGTPVFAISRVDYDDLGSVSLYLMREAA